MRTIGKDHDCMNFLQRWQRHLKRGSSLFISLAVLANLMPEVLAGERLKSLTVKNVEGTSCPIRSGVSLQKHENGKFVLEIPALTFQSGGKAASTDQKLFCNILLGLETGKTQRVRLVSLGGSMVGELQKQNVAHVIHSQFYSKRPASAGQAHRLFGDEPIPSTIMTEFRDLWSDCGGFQELTLGIGGLFLERENQGTDKLAKITLKGPWDLAYTIEPCTPEGK